MTHRTALIIWFETPPKVSKGAFNYVSKTWGGVKVYYICNFDYPEYRKKVNWNDGDFGDAEVIILQGLENSDEIIRGMFENNLGAIHLISGFNNNIEKRIRKYAISGKYNIGLFSERPVEIGNWFTKMARLVMFQFKYRFYYYRYRRVVKVFLPLGELGIKTFTKYGWSKEIMYPFMYNPESHENSTQYSASEYSNRVRFLYVGRFYYITKGVDVLMEAAEKLHGDWVLDMVGGYGTKAEEVKSWIAKQEHVNFLGSWPSEEVSKRMQEYDVVVVPSRYDGWNLLVNEAINAGVGVITTNHAVSDEVVSSSGAGLVVPANNSKKFAEAMQLVIDNPNIIPTWKKNALDFIPRISPRTVGEYLIDILDHTFYNKKQKPKCPWLNK